MYETQRSEVRLPVHIIVTGSGTALLYYAKNTVSQPPPRVSVSQVKNLILCARTR